MNKTAVNKNGKTPADINACAYEQEVELLLQVWLLDSYCHILVTIASANHDYDEGEPATSIEASISCFLGAHVAVSSFPFQDLVGR